MKERGLVGRELSNMGLGPDDESVAFAQADAEELLLGYLDESDLIEPHGHRSWSRLDREARTRLGLRLLGLVEFSGKWAVEPMALVEDELSSDAVQRTLKAVTAYRETLPYASAERRWLVRLCDRANMQSSGHRGEPTRIEWITTQHETVVSDGQVRRLDGRELVERGWDWMRSAGRFRGNSTYEVITRNALCRIAYLIDFDTTQRKEHPELRDFER